MFSLVQSQNTLEQVRVTITLPSGNIIYTGNTADTTIDADKSNATYGIKVNGGAIAKKSKGRASMNTSSDLQLGVNAGSTISYTIVPLADENYNYVLDGKSYLTGTFTIVPATLNLTASVTSLTYNGTSQNLSYSVTGAGVDTNYSVSNTSYTNAGSYTATLTKSSNNYVLGTSTIPWTISKAALTITSNNASMTYGSSLPTFGYTPSGFKGSDTSSVITGLVTHSTTGSSTANAGTYTITPNVAGLSATNYTFTAANGTLTINKATLTGVASTRTTTYNGDVQSVDITSINGTYTGSTSAGGANAGIYRAIINGSGNYTGSVDGTLTIYAATITLQGTGQSFTYNGTTQSPTIIVGGTARNDYSYIITGGSAINAGTYTARITSTTSNYVVSPTTNSFTWTISPADLPIVFTTSGDINIDAGNVNTIVFSELLAPNSAKPLTFNAELSGVITGSAPNLQQGYGVQTDSYDTKGFKVTLTATFNDPNYLPKTATKIINFLPPPDPPSGGGTQGTAEDGTGGGTGGGTTFTPE